MSERINTHDNRATIRWKLLTGASALALAGCFSSCGAMGAESSAHPQVWIELSGQLSRLDSSQERVSPPFFAEIESAGLASPLETETAPKYSLDGNAGLTFRPGNSDWVFSASVQYGRSANKHRVQQETVPPTIVVPGWETIIPSYGRFTETRWSSSEKHTLLDFQVGRDVGLGLFGHDGTSEIGAGVRFAQFSSVSQAFVNADPTLHYATHATGLFQFLFYDFHHNVYTENDYAERSFRGVGPTLSWQGSSPFAGNAESAELSIDWSAKAALLFGRQEARGHHQSTRDSCPNYLFCLQQSQHTIDVRPDVPHDRSRRVTVPNIGGSIGISFRSGDAKVSFGYRADLFMNALDTGFDKRKSSNILFHGPYASISVGL